MMMKKTILAFWALLPMTALAQFEVADSLDFDDESGVEVINEEELIQLMQERADIKYVTDIMPAADAKFKTLFEGRYFATPKKMGAQTAEANTNAGLAAANQIVGYLKDGITKFQVNK